ncbi:MFS transporter [Parapedobacter sp. GCM10030251]|uniref:MFS transporter n=1 Tax=Parapedobacter sp. GCM10030251 TaxID=3273419 RepID=UPI00360E98C1
MKRYQPRYEKLATLSTFVLVPLSGLVTDVYLPSFPEMQRALHTDVAGIQLTLSCFLISYGLTMLVAGSVVDTWGRYRVVLISLLLFALSNFAIAAIHQVGFVYAMRVLQGAVTALIVVSKRAFLADIFTGSKLKRYTSMLTVIWALGPITAPFIGGYLQVWFGWTANFHFLGAYALLALLMEVRFGGEAMERFPAFRFKGQLAIYRRILRATDFTYGLLTLGISYSMVMIFAMSAPFIVEHELGLTPVVTGYCALVSGLGLLCGGSIGRALTDAPLMTKLRYANAAEWAVALIMLASSYWMANLYSLMGFVLVMHMASGFIYNVYFTHCLTRFPRNAGVAGGLTSGGSYLVTSLTSYAIVSLLPAANQAQLAVNYLILIVITTGLLIAASFKTTPESGQAQHLARHIK